jgi:two-component system LytT family response regulator
MPPVVFVTAFERYAVDAFTSHAVDYVLKPVDRDRLDRALDRVHTEIVLARSAASSRRLVAALTALLRAPATDAAANASAAPDAMPHAMPDASPMDVTPEGTGRLALRSGRGLVVLETADVERVEGAGYRVRVHTRHAVHVVRETLNALAARLDGARFVRVHRSTIVNVARVDEVRPARFGDRVAVLSSGAIVRVSRTHWPALEARLVPGAAPPARQRSP